MLPSTAGIFRVLPATGSKRNNGGTFNEYRVPFKTRSLSNVTFKSDVNFSQAILTAVLVTLLVMALLFCVAFQERDKDGNVIGVSKPVFNFFK